MAEREFSFVIFGASGYAGQCVIDELIALKLPSTITWAIAGRSGERLQEILKAKGKETVPIVIADVCDYESIKAMCARAQIILTVVGPYRKYGEPVVKACVEVGTDYVDLCGEPEFLERMQLTYSKQAEQSGSLILQSCGFDSIPSDFGSMTLKREFEKAGAALETVETFVTFEGGALGINFATYEAAVLGFSSTKELQDLRKNAGNSKPKLNFLTPKPPMKPGPFTDSRLPNKTCYRFPGSDASVIRRTQEQLMLANSDYKAFHGSCYFAIDSGFLNTARMTMYGGLFRFLTGFEKGRELLLNRPELFSNGIVTKKGPTKEQLAKSSFRMDIFGIGRKPTNTDQGDITPASHRSPIPATDSTDKTSRIAQGDIKKEDSAIFNSTMNTNKGAGEEMKISLIIKGPDPGYIATASMLVAAARVILEKREVFPKGGVCTPGYYLAKTPCFEDLIKERNITLELHKQ